MLHLLERERQRERANIERADARAREDCTVLGHGWNLHGYPEPATGQVGSGWVGLPDRL